jgi:hypothetical protein
MQVGQALEMWARFVAHTATYVAAVVHPKQWIYVQTKIFRYDCYVYILNILREKLERFMSAVM